jgi:hypothetical protein
MSRRVEFGGSVHQFPDDAGDAEIAQTLDAWEQQQRAAKPPLVAPPPPPAGPPRQPPLPAPPPSLSEGLRSLPVVGPIAESVSRLPRLVTEGVPRAAETFTQIQGAPTLGLGLRRRAREAEPVFGAPPEQPSFARQVLFGGISPLPAILSGVEQLMRLPHAFGAAAAELGPEKAKPLTEAAAASLPFAGPVQVARGVAGAIPVVGRRLGQRMAAREVAGRVPLPTVAPEETATGAPQAAAARVSEATPEGQAVIARAQAELATNPPPASATRAVQMALESEIVEAFAGEPGRVTRIKDWLGRNLIPNFKRDEEAVALFREHRGRQAFAQAQAGRQARAARPLGLTRDALERAFSEYGTPEGQAIIGEWRDRILTNNMALEARGLPPADAAPWTGRVYLRDVDPSYQPSRAVRDRARDYLRQNLLVKGRPASPAEVEHKIKELLESRGTPVRLEQRPSADPVLTALDRTIEVLPGRRQPTLPAEIRQLLGEIDDGAYLAAKTVMDQEVRLASDDLFRAFAQGTEEMTLAGGRRVQVPWVRDKAAPGYRRLRGDANVGVLRGQYVLEKYAKDLEELASGGEGAAASAMMNWYLTYINWFKVSKTVLNPATHARNVTGNLMFADLAGVAPWDPRNALHYRRALTALRAGADDPVFREAIEHGAIGVEFAGPDARLLVSDALQVAQDRGTMAALKELGARPIRAAGRLYNAEDQIPKLAAYTKQRAAGASPREAAQHVNTWFPNYAEVAPAVQALRGSQPGFLGGVAASVGNPFASFKAEAIRIAANAAREHPIKLAKWMVLPAGLTYASMAAKGVSVEDARRAFRTLPDFLQQPFTWLLPWRDEAGNLQFWDLTYHHPLGDLIALNPRSPAMRQLVGSDNPLTATLSGLPAAFLGGSPFTLAVLQTLTNRDFFTGQALTTLPLMTVEGAKAFLGRQAGELPVPPLLEFGARVGARALAGQREVVPPRFGQRRTVLDALVEEASGVKPVPTNVELRRSQAAVLQARVREVEQELRRAMIADDRPRVRALLEHRQSLIQASRAPTRAERFAIPLPLRTTP